MLSDDIDKKLESKIDKKLIEKLKKGNLSDGFKNNKVINEVLDKNTMLTLYDMINSHIISYVNGVVRAGKESVVFWAKDKEENDIALKIYLVSTSNFKRRSPYILGDPRFNKIKKGTRNLVNLWAKKEFLNLNQAYENGLPVVRPIHISKNVLAMSFEGKDGVPEKTLLESEVDMNDYDQTISFIKDLYKQSNLVHGDLSAYNIFKTKDGIKVFDLGSAVDISHPNSREFLERDINNITNFFVKRGFTVKNPLDIIDEVIN